MTSINVFIDLEALIFLKTYHTSILILNDSN